MAQAKPFKKRETKTERDTETGEKKIRPWSEREQRQCSLRFPSLSENSDNSPTREPRTERRTLKLARREGSEDRRVVGAP